MSLPGSTDSPYWGQPEVYAQKQLGLSGLGTLIEKLQHPQNSMCLLNREVGLLHVAEQGGGVITFL